MHSTVGWPLWQKYIKILNIYVQKNIGKKACTMHCKKGFKALYIYNRGKYYTYVRKDPVL
jgi:hypothetical protein